MSSNNLRQCFFVYGVIDKEPLASAQVLASLKPISYYLSEAHWGEARRDRRKCATYCGCRDIHIYKQIPYMNFMTEHLLFCRNITHAVKNDRGNKRKVFDILILGYSAENKYGHKV